MYIPKHFREERPDILAKAIQDIQLAVLITPGADGLQISHVPMVLKELDNNGWVLESHVSRGNTHWSAANESAESVAVFRGPQAYISPSWYESKREHGKVVPTWTYIAVHAHGNLTAIEDPSWLLAHITDLTNINEGKREHPWQVSDAPDEYINNLTRAIVGLRLDVTRVEGSWKMNQHRSDADRLGVISGLDSEPAQKTVADIMRGLETERSG